MTSVDYTQEVTWLAGCLVVPPASNRTTIITEIFLFYPFYYRARHQGHNYCPRKVKVLKITEGQVKIKMCLPYMAGKISSCNFRVTYRKVNSKFILLYLLQGRSKLCRQVEIKVHLPYLASAFKSWCWALYYYYYYYYYHHHHHHHHHYYYHYHYIIEIKYHIQTLQC